MSQITNFRNNLC